MKQKEAFIPVARADSIRHEIISLLKRQTLSAREISAEVGISEKGVYDHLVHVQKSLNTSEHHLVVSPSECRECGFVFKHRDKLKKPGKCPVCRSESISAPLFSIEED